jgi:siroheme synthase-like protein
VTYYPVFLDLRGRPCVVVGGGPVAEGKVLGLLEAGARVTIVAPELTSGLAALAREGRVAHVPRGYRPGDLAGAFLAIGGTDDRSVNAQVWEEAAARGVLLNLVDDPPRCGFIAPAVLRRGDLAVAVTTGGKAPALAVRLRERLERELGSEHARFLEIAGEIRGSLTRRVPDFEQRRALWYRLVDSDVLDLLRRGDDAGARGRAAEITGVPLGDDPGAAAA